MITALVLDAVRSWRRARDNRLPVQAAIHQSFVDPRWSVMAPVFASLLSLHEACSGRRFQVGRETHVTCDELRLLKLLKEPAGCDVPVLDGNVTPSLIPALRIALRSTRIMMRLSLDKSDARSS